MSTRTSGPPGTKVHRYQKIRFWHEQGFIVMADERTDERQVLAPVKAKERVVALLREATRMREGGWKYRDETAALLTTVRDLMSVIVEAKKYGDPFDPEVAEKEAHLNREIRVYLSGKAKPRFWLPGDT